MQKNIPLVDAVVAWVDGSDPKHRAKRQKHLAGYEQRPSSTAETRFADNGEIEYCVLSIFKFIPWIRNIFIITDSQVPAFLDMITDASIRERIRVVDHQELFSGYEGYLPVFNSLSIEAMLWNIDGLSEDFLYFNDDFVLVNDVPVQAFFNGRQYVLKGKIRIRRRHTLGCKIKKILGVDRKKTRVGYRDVQENAADLVSKGSRYLDLPHCPHILNRSFLRSYFKNFPELLTNTIRHKFRHPDQIWSVSLFCHHLLETAAGRIDNQFKTTLIKSNYSTRRILRLFREIELGRSIFLCVQNIDKADDCIRHHVFHWLQKRIKS